MPPAVLDSALATLTQTRSPIGVICAPQARKAQSAVEKVSEAAPWRPAGGATSAARVATAHGRTLVNSAGTSRTAALQRSRRAGRTRLAPADVGSALKAGRVTLCMLLGYRHAQVKQPCESEGWWERLGEQKLSAPR